jgi:single-strand DNA-binding protein
MAGSVNKAIIVGNCGKDPVIRTTQGGQKIATMSLATSESWKDKNTGERRENVQWHTVVIFNENLAKVVEQYIEKGTKVYVEGQIQTRKWQDKQGQDRYTTEIVLQGFHATLQILSGGRERGERTVEDRLGDDEGQRKPASNSRTSQPSGGGRGFGGGTFDDEIPFCCEYR